MLQTAKKISTSTKFHLWDVLKLKKKELFFISTILLNIRTFEKKKSKICSKIAKISYFWNFKFWFAAGIGRESADMWQEGRLSPQVFPKFFLCQTDKNWRIYLKKTYPPKKAKH